MYLLNNVFTTEHGEAITVLQLLTKIKMSLSEIDNYLNEYGNRLNSIEFKNTEQDADILILNSQVATLQTKVNNIQLTLGDYLLRFNDLDMQLQVINGKITTNENDISQLQTYVNNIGTQIININNTLNLLDLTVQGHTTQISDLQNVNTTQTTQITNLSQMITDIEQRLSDIEPVVSTLTSNIQTLTTNIENINTSITSLNSRVTILENTTPGNGGSLTKLFNTSKHYGINSGQGTTLELGTYVFAQLPPDTDFSKIILVAVPYGDSAGDCQEICRCGFQATFYIQSGVDMFLYARFLIPANQNVSLRVNYTVYLRD